MLDVGKLRHRLTILTPTNEQDSDTGEIEVSWFILDTVWGAFEPYSTKDVIAAASTQGQTNARAIIRYRDFVLDEMRILFRNHLYEIVGSPLADVDSGKEFLTLMLRELDSGDFSYELLPDGGLLRTKILFVGPVQLDTDGIETSFVFDDIFLSGSLSIYINGIFATHGNEYNRKIDNTGVDFVSPPEIDDVVEVMYAKAV